MKNPFRLHLFLVFSVGLLILSCNRNNVKEDPSLKKFFEENHVTGFFTLFDNGTGRFTTYNFKRYRDSSYLPASTFKIVNSLIGLQTGVITDDSMVIRWDGITRPVKEWNQDLNMYTAFRVSAVPYYQEVARRIGKDSMEHWLGLLHYAAGIKDTVYKIRTRIDTFWLDNSMKISGDEQLAIVKKLYFRDLKPFFKTYQDVVKRAMTWEQNPNYTLAYKTGWGKTELGHHLGWVVGWLEEDGHPYFFVLNLESDKPDFDMVTVRKKMLTDILKYEGFMGERK